MELEVKQASQQIERALEKARRHQDATRIRENQSLHLGAFYNQLAELTATIQGRTTTAPLKGNYQLKKLMLQVPAQSLGRLQNQQSGNACRKSQHLKELLAIKDASSQSSLQARRLDAYKYIEAKLREEEPFMWEKIVDRIRRAAKWQSKLHVLKILNQQINTHKQWLKVRQMELHATAKEKQVGNLAVTILANMKNMMSEKILTDNRLYDIYKGMEGALSKFESFHSNIKNAYIEACTFYQQLKQYHQILKDKQQIEQLPLSNKELDFQTIESLIQEGNHLVDAKYPSELKELISRCQALQQRIDLLYRSL